MTIVIPESLTATCDTDPGRRAWLAELPRAIQELQARWALELATPFDTEVSCSWVAPALRQDGTRAILKLGMPHMEAEHEIQALRFWDGDPAVRLLAADEAWNALLLERCEPGTPLRRLPEPEQDVVIAGLLRRLWRVPAEPHPFRPLATMTAAWASQTRADRARWSDVGLIQEGLRLFAELARPAPHDVLLATDLHAGNVLRAQREPWLVIDPKPFVGDPAYDATQHLLNCFGRLQADPDTTIRRFADLLEVDHERVRLWLFARLAAFERDDWNDESMALARMLA
jgi:streptomycin 6-kinase